jgi:DNA polymerase-3 subunit epsilon
MRPPFNCYDAVNTAVHGITPQMTEDAPEFWLQWPAIAAVLEGETVVAHYAPFDMGVINDECQRCGLPLPEFRFVCSCALSRFVVPELESHALEPLCAHFGISTDGHHRAGSDALMTAKLMLCLCEAAGVDSIDALVEKYRYRFGSFHEGTYTPFHRIPDYTGKTNLDHFAKEYQADADGFDELSPFYGKEVVFTGTMNSPRQELMRLVMDIGGRTKDSLTRTADFLVVGQQDYRVVGEDGMSSKQKKALAMIEKGAPLTVLSEEEFLKMVSGSHGFGKTDFLDLPHDEIERLGKLFPSLTVLDFEKMKGILY